MGRIGSELCSIMNFCVEISMSHYQRNSDSDTNDQQICIW